MSSHDPTTEQPVYPVHAAVGPAPAPGPPDAGPDGDGGDFDDDDAWVSEAPKGLRVRAVTGGLLLALFAVSGFWGGAILQKHHDKSTSGAAVAAASGAARRAAAGGALGGAGGGPGQATGTGAGTGGTGGTTGIVTDIQGPILYLTDAGGNLVKVTLMPSSAISRTAPGTAADLQQGQTVTVSGSKGADGSTTARSITISPPTAAGVGAAGGGG